MTEHELMLMTVKDCNRSELYLRPRTLSESEASLLESMQNRRREGEPLQYILGKWDFMGTQLLVDRRALIPRPETELLVENAIQNLREFFHKDTKTLRVLDIGTGTGNISIALAQSFPQAKITTTDLSQDALDLAQTNAELARVSSQIEFLHQDMRYGLKNFKASSYDAIISNPPYIPSDEIASLAAEVQCEPLMALDGGKDGLDFFRVIIENAGTILSSGGFLFLEIGHGQGEAVSRLINGTKKFAEVSLLRDFSDKERIVIAQKGCHNEKV